MTEPTGGSSSADLPSATGNWSGLRATPRQAMRWGIALCGQLAALHREGVVVGRIAAATIGRSGSGEPRLPPPDPRATNAPWEDVSALADAIRTLVPDPPPELTNALLPPYANAVALGEELQDAERALGIEVTPIPVDEVPAASLGGIPIGGPEPTGDGPPAGDLPAELDVDPADLARNPNAKVLLAIVVVVLLAALVVGLGWR